MKIILEGTEAELRSVLRSFGIPQESVTVERTFAELKAIAENHLNDFVGTDKTERPQRVELNLNFMSDPDNDKIKALAKEQANRRRQVYRQLHHSQRQT